MRTTRTLVWLTVHGRLLHAQALGVLVLLPALAVVQACGDTRSRSYSGGQAGAAGRSDLPDTKNGRSVATEPPAAGSGDGGSSAEVAGDTVGQGGVSAQSGGLAGDGGVSAQSGGLAGDGGVSAQSGGSAGDGGVSAQSGGLAGGGGAQNQTLPLEGKPCAGYTLLGVPETSTGSKFAATLIDMNGSTVHQWPIAGFPPKMLPGGSLIGCFGVVGTYDCVEMRQVSWDGQIEWSFSDWVDLGGNTTAARQHHDFQREGNPVGFYAPGQSFVDQGNTLVLAHVGQTVPAIRQQSLLDDVIYEVDWSGSMTGFEWHGAVHVDQFGFDEAARNDIRTRAPNNNEIEWLHGNSLSRLGSNHWFDQGYTEFHPDNILYSSREANFVIIISRQTGNVVWRIGPDFVGRPEQRLGQFAGQHHPHMIPRNLPGAGNILVFDNGGASGYGGTSTTGAPNRYSRANSRVLEFNPVTFEIVWQYGSEAGEENFYSQLISSAQRLPNGNTLITIGMQGRVIEVTPSRRIVWTYQQAAGSSGKATASLYRSYRIPPEWLPPGENDAYGHYATWASLFER